MDNYNLKKKYQEEFNNIIKLHTTNIIDIEDVLNTFDIKENHNFIYMYNNRNNIDNIDIEYINNIFSLFNELNRYPLQNHNDGIVHIIFSMYYKLIYLLKIYNNVKNNPNSLYLYGGLELSTFNSENLNIFILGEVHLSNIINIPTNCIYIYELFELIIEYSIKTSEHKIHILLENVLGQIPFINNNDDIINRFLLDSCGIYYYLNLCRKFLNLTTMDLDNINRFNSLLRYYNLNESVISNFVNNGLDRIEFHFIDHRNFMENLFKQTDIVHYDTTIQNNYLIFPDKFPNYEENKSCIKCFLKEIFDENGISIYRTLWDELNLDQKTIDLINYHTSETIYSTYLMDQIVILKYLYFKKRDENFTFIFFGGSAHGNKYTNFIQEYENILLRYSNGNDSFYNKFSPLPNLIDNINYNHNILDRILTKPAYKYNTYIYDYIYVLNEPDILQSLINMYYNFDDIKINNKMISNIMKKFIDKRFIKLCKSNYTDNEEKLYGGANLQQQLIQKSILEKIEYYEMKNSVLFKGKTFNDIVEYMNQLLEYSKVDINRVGGNINLNKWIDFLLF
jgi:hypothetical protein